jgi:multiple sugar transport system permease protein
MSATVTEASARAPQTGRSGVLRSLLDRRFSWLALVPVFLIVALLMLGPIVNLFYLALHQFEWRDGNAHAQWVGWRNIAAFGGDKLYWVGLRNTTLFALAAVSLQMLFGFLLALAVSRNPRGRTLFVAIFLIPIIVPPIVIGAIWKLILNYDLGVLNAALVALGVDRADWLGDARFALAAVIAVDVWHWTPFAFLLILAGFESLPRDVYEASKLDTLSMWQELRHITLPLIWPTLLVTALFRLVLSFKVFDEIYLLTSGGPGTATEVVSYSIYRTFFAEDRVGLGAVMSLFTLFVIALSAILLINLRRKEPA